MPIRYELGNGWAWDSLIGAVCQFEQRSIEELEEKRDARTLPFVVETVNSTLAADGNSMHFNRYFLDTMPDAIALATRIEINFAEVEEEIVAIRPATDAEATVAFKVGRYFRNLMPDAISHMMAESIEDDE